MRDATGDVQFQDRRDAGRKLAQRLRKFKKANSVVLALPRGGVPVGYEVAKALGAPLDLLFVRKICAPGHPELGLGAVVDGAHPETVLNDELVRALAPEREYLEAEEQRQFAEIERRRARYTSGRPPIETSGRTVIVVDDGVATGASIKAALKGIDRNEPEWLVLAVPVAPPSTLLDLQAAADELVCLLSPEPFTAVSAYYEDFAQTTDQEVAMLLGAVRPKGGASLQPSH